jgi:XTP/dITP diphosphohydrolase
MNLQKKKVIIASNNVHKLIEIKEMLKDFPFDVMSLNEAGINIEVVEDGKTFEENAYKKASEIMKITNETVIADDSGLEVSALNGAPGVYSARFAGEHGNYKKNNMKLLELLKDVPYDKRGARFVTSIVYLTPEGDQIKAQGYINGIIGFEEKGSNGFGYDPLFIVPELNKTFAELKPEEKNAISHRSRALADLKQQLMQF